MSQLLQVTLLGAPTIVLANQPLTGLLTPKTLALFIYLAVSGQPQPRDHLADLFWHELNAQQARNNLRYLLPDLRQHLDTHLTITAETIGFNRQAPYWLDVERLQTVLRRELAVARQKPAPAVDIPALQTALDLYRDKFLAGFTVRNAPLFEGWVRQQENELHHLAVQGFYTLAESCYHQGEIQGGLTANQHLLRWEPWHEAGHRLQMRLLVAAGQRSAAVAHYTLCRQLLAAEVGAEPEAATTALYEEIRRGLHANPPGREEDRKTRRQKAAVSASRDEKGLPATPSGPALSPSQPARASLVPQPTHPPAGRTLPHNLPVQLTPFVGRVAEIDQLCARLTAAGQPLMTLTGLGGSGKTRLALAVAQKILDSGAFPDGVWFVPLIGLSAGENLADRLAVAIMDALQLPRMGPLAPTEQLLDGLRDHRLLLILDNFEHLLAGVDLIYTLLQRVPGVKLVVTSRQPLNLQAEAVWQLAGLATPAVAVGATMTPVEAQGYDSIALFVERTQRVDRDFRLDQRNLADILHICHFVQGLPLAIELAAAMLRHYDSHDLWQRLQQDYTALAVNQRDLPPRHRTITDLFAYSWRTLSVAEAMTLAACAIFPQSFTTEAAAAVADATHAILAALIDQSLLKQSSDGRFELHELVRQYAATQFARDPQAVVQCRQRHADYYSALIEPDAEELMRTPHKFQLIQQELPNIRLAWLWGVEQHQLAPLMRLSEGLFLHFLANGPVAEGWDLCYAVVERIRHWSTPPANEREARFLALAPAGTAYLGYYLGRYAEVTQLAHEAIARAEPLGDGRALAMGYSMLAMVAFVQGDFAEHERLGMLAVAFARSAPFSHMVAVNLAFLGMGLAVQGKISAARTALQEALDLVQKERFVYLEGYILSELGFIYAMSGDWALAEGTTQQALQLNLGLNNALNRGHQYTHLALYAEALGDYDRAIAWTDQVLAFRPLMPDPNNDLSALLVRGRAMRYLGHHAEAESACQQLLTLAQTLGRPTECAQARIELGHVLLAQQRRQMAEGHYQAALAIAATGHLSWQAAAQAGLAQVRLQQNDLGQALQWVEKSLHLLLTQALDTQYEVVAAALGCYQVLSAAHDARASVILRRAYDWVEAQSLKISDENLRHSFLAKAPYHQQLQSLVQSAGDRTAESTDKSS